MEVRIPRRAINAAYLPLLDDNNHRYIVLFGGAGSGKSVFAAQRIIIDLMRKPLCNVLVVRKVGDTNRKSTYALLQQTINRWGLGQLFRVTDLRIVCKSTGNEVIFTGLDDVEKLKSVTFSRGELTTVWVEEASEIEESDFNQLDIRLRGKGIKGQIILTFNPVNILHWLKKRFFDTEDDRAVTLKTTYKDNAHLDSDYKRTLESYRDTDPYYYAVYCLGEWGVYGKTIFDAQAVTLRLAALADPVKIGRFDCSLDDADRITAWRWVDDDSADVRIYEDVIAGHPYVIGADTAGEGSDWFVAQVVDNSTGKQVATYRTQCDEDVFARGLYCLGMYYNAALLAVEANFSSYPIKELQRLKYPKQYVRVTEDSYTHKPKQSYGFRTTAVTRPIIIAQLVQRARDGIELFNDRDTLGEMLTFVRNEKGRAEAESGAHDDCVMSLAIAYYAGEQQRTTVEKPKAERVKWSDDMWEDYYNANTAGKAYLIKKWGEPIK